MADNRVVIWRQPWPSDLNLKPDGSTSTFRHAIHLGATSFEPRHSQVLWDIGLKTAAMFGVAGVVSAGTALEVRVSLSRRTLAIGSAATGASLIAAAALIQAGHPLIGGGLVAFAVAVWWDLRGECRQLAERAVRELAEHVTDDRGE